MDSIPMAYAETSGPSFQRRDWFVLPVVALVTALGIVGLAEVAARIVFPQQREILASCFVLNDAVHGVRGKPGCTFVETGRESGQVSYLFDRHGYRNPGGWSSADAYRIVMTGSSIALAEHVPQAQSVAAVLPQLVQERTGSPTTLYNEGMGFGFARNTDLRFQDVLDASPNLILWMITPYDIAGASLVNPTMNLVSWGNQSLQSKILSRMQSYFENESFQQAASDFLGRTRIAYAFRYFVYRSPSLYLKSYLSQADSEQGFLRDSYSLEWRRDLQEVQSYAADISRQAHAAHVPLVIVYVPNHAQSEMVALGTWPSGYDPYQLDDILHRIVAKQGDIYLDILPGYHNISLSEIQQDYLVVDGHPNARGQALIARLIAQQLTSGIIPALRTQQPVGKEQ